MVTTCVASESSSDISNMSGEEERDTTDSLGVGEEAVGTVSVEVEYDGSALPRDTSASCKYEDLFS